MARILGPESIACRCHGHHPCQRTLRPTLSTLPKERGPAVLLHHVSKALAVLPSWKERSSLLDFSSKNETRRILRGTQGGPVLGVPASIITRRLNMGATRSFSSIRTDAAQSGHFTNRSVTHAARITRNSASFTIIGYRQSYQMFVGNS